MKKKIFIVVADYYKDISTSLVNSAKKKIKKLIYNKNYKSYGSFRNTSHNFKKY